MVRENHYILASLPGVGELGSSPPLCPKELLERVTHVPRLATLLSALFLGHDLVLREAYLAGEIEEPEDLALLTPEQARNEAPLPSFLLQKGEERRIPADDLWEAYWRYCASIADCTGNRFLRGWVRFEVALRNALAAARAKALDLDPTDYLVAPELAEEEADVAGLVAEWSAASTPLAGHQILERARWEWVRERERWFSFSDDEVAAYATKLLLLDRWLRLAKAQGAGESGSGAS